MASTSAGISLRTEGKGRNKVFDPGMFAQALRRLELDRDLRRALEQEEFKLHYQPKVLLDGGSIVGMETLVRWEHTERGLIRPEELIRHFEEIRLIVPLGRWVLRETCQRTREWGEQYPAVDHEHEHLCEAVPGAWFGA